MGLALLSRPDSKQWLLLRANDQPVRFGYPANMSFRSDSGPGSVSLVLSVPRESLRKSLRESFAVTDFHSAADRVVLFFRCPLPLRLLSNAART